MKTIAMILSGLLVTSTALAGDVYVTRDAQGNPIYTDTPQTVPAQKLDVRTADTDQAAVSQRYSAEMSQYAKDEQANASPQQQQATQASTEDKAKRCADARERYEKFMTSMRLYETGPNGERVYLTSEQIDQARANAKQVMDQFCSEQ